MIVFVGDCPSRFNDNPNIAFIGTKSYQNLAVWINRMGISSRCFLKNSDTKELIKEIMAAYARNWAIVALGNNASKRLTKVGVLHFKLPHPSPRNRLLNSKEFIETELVKCQDFLRIQGITFYQ